MNRAGVEQQRSVVLLDVHAAGGEFLLDVRIAGNRGWLVPAIEHHAVHPHRLDEFLKYLQAVTRANDEP